MYRGPLNDPLAAGVLQARLDVRVHRPLVRPPQVLAPYHCAERTENVEGEIRKRTALPLRNY